MQFPYAEVQIRSDGSVHDRRELDEAVRMVTSSQADDVLVLVHGWNSDIPAAKRLYQRLTDSIAGVRARVPASAGRTIAVIGVLWPSVRWADDDALAGGGAGLVDSEAELSAAIAEQIENPLAAAELAALVPDLDRSPQARARFLDLLRQQLPSPAPQDDDPPPLTFTEGDAQTAFELAATGDGLLGEPAGGGAAGFSFGGLLGGARNLLNLTTYYTMKDRAGVVGSRGVADLLDAVHRASDGVRVHLAGHSFGARVATSAAAASTVAPHSMCLLQGAFSHYGLSKDWDGRGSSGVFEPVPGRMRGPIAVTFTGNDRAVGLAYAVASRLARQSASGLGDANDPYGGIGRNGALRTPNADPGTLLDVGGSYTLAAGRVANLKADRFVAGHGDIAGPQVGYAVLTALCS